MLTVIETLLALIAGLLPALGTPAVVSDIIAALIQIVPVIAAELPTLLASVQSIIADLKVQGNVTPEQLAQLAALDAQIDAAFEAAAQADGE